jgi:translation initiation factor IF-3
VPRVFVVSADGEKLGIMPTHEAIRRAEEVELDLVEVAPNSDPPVCRIMDYGKFKYRQKKRKRMGKKTAGSTIKEIRLRPKIEIHDLQVKVNHALEFIKGGHRVQLNLMFKGREMVHSEIGSAVLNKFIEMLGDAVKMEKTAQLEGKRMTCILAPK